MEPSASGAVGSWAPRSRALRAGWQPAAGPAPPARSTQEMVPPSTIPSPKHAGDGASIHHPQPEARRRWCLCPPSPAQSTQEMVPPARHPQLEARSRWCLRPPSPARSTQETVPLFADEMVSCQPQGTACPWPAQLAF